MFKVALSTIGTFHMFDLARELKARDALEVIFSGYPRFKLKRENLPSQYIRTFPWLHAPYMALPIRAKLGARANRLWERLDQVSMDAFVSAGLPRVDVYVGMSGSSLWAGRQARKAGMRYVCDRGSTHIRVQDRLVREEDQRWGLSSAGVDPWMIEREEAEYAEADCITVPSAFNVRTFIAQGVPEHKLRKLSYGVNIEKFYPDGQPTDGSFDILFAGGMSLRKGIPYVLQAYKALVHPRKTLSFAGVPSPETIALMRRHGLWSDDIRILGHLDQATLRQTMSKSHVLMLPSIEEGLALVQAQAMACACPVLATENTGCEDLFEHGEQGFITRVRDVEAMSQHLQTLADQPELRREMSRKALARVQHLGGTREYGRRALEIYQSLV
jgi:starch synthase